MPQPHSTNYSNLLSAINRNIAQLLHENSADTAQMHSNLNSNSYSSQIQPLVKVNANSTHIHSISQLNMTSPNSNPQTPPTHSRVTFQSTRNSAVNSTRSSNEAQNSPNLELSREEVFGNNLTQLFTKGFLAV